MTDMLKILRGMQEKGRAGLPLTSNEQRLIRFSQSFYHDASPSDILDPNRLRHHCYACVCGEGRSAHLGKPPSEYALFPGLPLTEWKLSDAQYKDAFLAEFKRAPDRLQATTMVVKSDRLDVLFEPLRSRQHPKVPCDTYFEAEENGDTHCMFPQLFIHDEAEDGTVSLLPVRLRKKAYLALLIRAELFAFVHQQASRFARQVLEEIYLATVIMDDFISGDAQVANPARRPKNAVLDAICNSMFPGPDRLVVLNPDPATSVKNGALLADNVAGMIKLALEPGSPWFPSLHEMRTTGQLNLITLDAFGRVTSF
jgi:hypothetical protein